MKIPIVINNRDLVTWPRDMVTKLKTMDNVGDIIIVDNGSTYQPLLDWYETKPCDVIMIDNIGHDAPWASGVVGKLNTEYYIVTDPDMGLNDIPTDMLTILYNNMKIFNLNKIGLGLDWKIITPESPYYGHLMTSEKGRWENSRRIGLVFLDIAIDTTFAMYNKPEYFIGGASTGFPYIAKHFPWYLTVDERNNNEEFLYYIKNANCSSSYKGFLGL